MLYQFFNPVSILKPLLNSKGIHVSQKFDDNLYCCNVFFLTTSIIKPLKYKLSFFLIAIEKIDLYCVQLNCVRNADIIGNVR